MKEQEKLPMWAELLHEYYGVYLTAGRVRFWMDELRRPAPGGTGTNTTDSEIEAAVRFFRDKIEKEGGDGKRGPAKASLDDLMMWIRWRRKEMRQGTEHAQEACAICVDGWVTAYRTLPDLSEVTLDHFYSGGSPCSVPCMCDRGRHWMQTCTDYAGITDDQRQALQRLAQLGARQESRRRALAATQHK